MVTQPSYEEFSQQHIPSAPSPSPHLLALLLENCSAALRSVMSTYNQTFFNSTTQCYCVLHDQRSYLNNVPFKYPNVSKFCNTLSMQQLKWNHCQNHFCITSIIFNVALICFRHLCFQTVELEYPKQKQKMYFNLIQCVSGF